MRGVAIKFISFYQHVLSPYWPGTCRYTPTCSHYAQDAVTEYGVLRGFWMFLRRFSSCRPGGGSGYDPVPLKREQHEAAAH